MHTANIKKLIQRVEKVIKPPRIPIIPRAIWALRAKKAGTPYDGELFTDDEIRRVLEAAATKDSFVIELVDKEISAAHGIK